ncbi:hypothetical protein Hanom_Chr13g01215761 [Helianthus anomalus]
MAIRLVENNSSFLAFHISQHEVRLSFGPPFSYTLTPSCTCISLKAPSLIQPLH